MSRVERKRLQDYWLIKVQEEFIEKISELQKSHDQICQDMNKLYGEGRRQILINNDVIGMITSGAAKFQNLVISIQHIILIGDPNQLRSHIATYSLSMNSQLE